VTEEIGSPNAGDATARLEKVANKALLPAIEIGKRFQQQFQREFGSVIMNDAKTVGLGRAIQRHKDWVKAMERISG